MKATLKLKKITICNMDTLELEGGLGTAILDTTPHGLCTSDSSCDTCNGTCPTQIRD